MILYITRIKLKNFRCYRDEEIVFQDGIELNKPITIFYGLEGSGKTVIFNAVGWALYREETEVLLNEQKQDLAIPNLNAFSDSNQAEVLVSVDLKFEKDKQISRVRITRKAEYLKGMADASHSFSEADIFYANGNTRSISDDEEKGEFNIFMETYFPKQLLEFYMFTGEYLKRTYTTKGDNLQRGIKGQFKIGAIKYMADVLNDIKNNYAKIARKKSNNLTLKDELTKENENKEKLDGQRREVIDTITKLNGEVTKEEYNISRYSEEYGRLKEKSERIKERDELSNDLKKKKDQKRDLEATLYKSIFEKACFLNAKKELDKSAKEIGEEVGKRKLPPDVEAPFVKSLLEGHTCICGREILQGSEEESHLLHILKEKEPEQGVEILTYLQGPIRIIQDSLVDWERAISQAKNNLDTAIREENELYARLASISDLEKGLTEAEKDIKEKYESTLRRKDEINSELDIQNGKKSRIEKEISEKTDRIRDIDSKIFQESEKSKDVDDARNNYEIAGFIQKALEQIPEDLFKSYAERLQDKMKDILKSFNIISQFTAKVSYNGNGLSFAFKELSTEFEEFGAYMSGGQNQLVGICMMASFISVLGDIGRNIVEPPLVFMDHPISNLSEKGKALFQQNLTTIFKGIQLIIIATDGEIPGFLEHSGKENISRIYQTENDKIKKLSHIKEMN